MVEVGTKPATAGPPSATLARRMLQAAIRELHKRDGRTTTQLASVIGVGTSTVARWLRGEQDLKPPQVRLLLDAYGYPTDHETTIQLVQLAETAKRRGMTQPRLEPWMAQNRFDLFITLEGDAARADTYESTLVPGLLQTAPYAEAVLRSTAREGTRDVDIDKQVHVRLARQEALHRTDRPPLRMLALLDEAVLLRAPTTEVMRGQLEHLRNICELPNVTIRVIPFTAGPHPAGVTGPFVILHFDHIGPVGYSENPASALYAEDSEEAKRYQAVLERVQRIALDTSASLNRITEALRAL